MKKKILFPIMAALCSPILAQSNVENAVVNIENDYAPVVIEVNKRGFTPTIDETENTTPLELVFSYDAQPHKEFASDRDAASLFPAQERTYPGYARVGYGLTNDIDTRLAYTLRTSDRGKMNMLASFGGFDTNIDGVFGDWDSRMFKTAVGAGYRHEFDGLTLDVAATFGNRVFNYQHTGGINVGNTDKQNSRSYRIETKGVTHLAGPFSYTFDGGFTYNRRSYSTATDEGTGEVGASIGGSIAYEVNESGLRNMGVELAYDGFLYNSTLRDAYNGFDNYSSFDVNPFLNFTLGEWKLKVGTKMNFITGNGARFAIAPDIMLEGNCAERIGLYAGITGGRAVNSLAALEERLPYWGFDIKIARQLKPTYRVADIKAGVKIDLEPVSLDFFAGYAYTKDDVLEAREYSQRSERYALIYSNPVQANTHNTFIGGRAGYDHGGWLNVSALARYDYWNCDNKDLLVMKPMLTIDLNAEMRFFEEFTLRAGYTFEHYTAGEDSKRITNKNELYARASYRILDWLSAYIQGDNLLGSNYYEYAGYLTRGARGSIGATFNF